MMRYVYRKIRLCEKENQVQQLINLQEMKMNYGREKFSLNQRIGNLFAA